MEPNPKKMPVKTGFDSDETKIVELALQIFTAENQPKSDQEKNKSWDERTMKHYIEKAHASVTTAGRHNEPPMIHAFELFTDLNISMTAVEIAEQFSMFGWKGMTDPRTVDKCAQRIVRNAIDEIRQRRHVEMNGQLWRDPDFLRFHVGKVIKLLGEKVGLPSQPPSAAEAWIGPMVSTLSSMISGQLNSMPSPKSEEVSPDAVLRSVEGGCFGKLRQASGALSPLTQRSLALALENRLKKWQSEEPAIPNGIIADRVLVLADWLENIPKDAADHLRTCATRLKEGSTTDSRSSEVTESFLDAVRAINADWGERSALEFLKTLVPEDLPNRLRELLSRLQPEATSDAAMPADKSEFRDDILRCFSDVIGSLIAAIEGNSICYKLNQIGPPQLPLRSDIRFLRMLHRLVSDIPTIMSETDAEVPGAIELEADLLHAGEQIQERIMTIYRDEIVETAQLEFGIQILDEVLDLGPKSYLPSTLFRYAAERGIERRSLFRKRSETKPDPDA